MTPGGYDELTQHAGYIGRISVGQDDNNAETDLGDGFYAFRVELFENKNRDPAARHTYNDFKGVARYPGMRKEGVKVVTPLHRRFHQQKSIVGNMQI